MQHHRKIHAWVHDMQLLQKVIANFQGNNRPTTWLIQNDMHNGTHGKWTQQKSLHSHAKAEFDKTFPSESLKQSFQYPNTILNSPNGGKRNSADWKKNPKKEDKTRVQTTTTTTTKTLRKTTNTLTIYNSDCLVLFKEGQFYTSNGFENKTLSQGEHQAPNHNRKTKTKKKKTKNQKTGTTWHTSWWWCRLSSCACASSCLKNPPATKQM